MRGYNTKAMRKQYWRIIILAETILCVLVIGMLYGRGRYTATIVSDEIIRCNYNTYVKYINEDVDGLLSVSVNDDVFYDKATTVKGQKIAFTELSVPFGVYRMNVETNGNCDHQIRLNAFADKNRELFFAEDIFLKQGTVSKGYFIKLPLIKMDSYGYEFFLSSVSGNTTIEKISIEECEEWKGFAVIFLFLMFTLTDILIFNVANQKISPKIVSFLSNNTILPIVFMSCGYLMTLSLMIFKWQKIVDSDMASELVLGHELALKGGILDKAWCYSTELRVLNTQLIYKLLFRLLGDNWHMIRVCSVALFMVCIIGAALWFLKIIEMRKTLALWIAGILVWPFGSLYALIVLYGSYYVPHIVINFLSLSLMLCFCRIKEKNIFSVMLIAFLTSLSFAAGLGGVRQLMISYVPIILSGILLYLIEKDEDEVKIVYRFLIAATLALLCALAGYGLNHMVLQKIYTFSNMSEQMWNYFTVTDIVDTLSSFLHLLGYQSNVKFISINGAINALVIMLACYFIASCIYLIKRIQDIAFEKRVIIIYSIFTILFLAVIYVATNDTNETHWIPMIPFVFIILGLAYEMMSNKSKDRNKKVIYKGSCLISIVLSSVLLCMNPRMDPRIDLTSIYYCYKDISHMTDWLSLQGYSQGIATFWTGNVLTEYSNGNIEMWTIDTEQPEVRKWLQKKEHLEKLPGGRVFMIFTSKEIYENAIAMNIAEEYPECLVYADADFYIYEFFDIDTLGIIETNT